MAHESPDDRRSRIASEDWLRANEGSPDQPRDERGRWTSSGSDGGPLAKRLGTPDSGFTINTKTWHEPKVGYSVAIKDHEHVIPNVGKASTRDVSKAIAGYLIKHRAALGQPGHHFGGWHNPKDGHGYLDVARVVDKADEAKRLAVEHGQKAYFDFKNGRSVEVKR